jgi:transcriptional regulator
MYRPAAFAIDDVAAIHNVVRERAFATFSAIHRAKLRLAYAPAVVDSASGPLGAVRFHVASRNPFAEFEDGTRAWMSLIAADAYVSPDWYRSITTVPTWNYVAVEGEGALRRLTREELGKLLEELTAQEESRLAPKPPWTIDKVPKARADALMNVITGFSLTFESLEGKLKLSQDKSPEDFAGVVSGLEARGDAASLAVARAMRSVASRRGQ